MTVMKQLRLAKKMTQSELSHIVRVHSSAISAIENQKMLAWKKIREQLAKVFAVDEKVLFDERGLAKGCGEEDEENQG